MKFLQKSEKSCEKGIRLTSRTYALFIKATRKLTQYDNGRDNMIKEVMEFFCRDGLVNHHVKEQIKRLENS